MDTPIVRADPTGFPMIYIDELDAYIHWLPVTKLQFEQFLCATPQFDSAWYEQLLRLNPRIAPDRVTSNNYWRAVLTAVLPAEAQAFATWCGEGYSLPTLDEWFSVYTALKALPPEHTPIADHLSVLGQPVGQRVRTLLAQVEAASIASCRQAGYERTAAHQLLLRLGVMEWVETKEQRTRWCGMGETSPQFHGTLFTPDHGQPSRPHQPESQRLHHYGFRLLWRA